MFFRSRIAPAILTALSAALAVNAADVRKGESYIIEETDSAVVTQTPAPAPAPVHRDTAVTTVKPPNQQQAAAATDTSTARSTGNETYVDSGNGYILERTAPAPAPRAPSVPSTPTAPRAVRPQTPVEPAPARSSRRPEPYNWFSLNIHLAFFHYQEILPIQETIDFLHVSSLIGRPKSVEHGLCEGLEFESFRHLAPSPLFIRPQITGFLGLLQTYDGTTQGQPQINGNGDTVAVFTPVESRKNNFFLRGSFEFGGGYFGPNRMAVVFTGIDGCWWGREFPGAMSERYYWLSLPIGVLLDFPLGGRWSIGCEAKALFMLAGRMKVNISTRGTDGEQAPDFPAVDLSSGEPFLETASLRLDVPFRARMSSRVSLRIDPYFQYYHFERSNTAVVDNGDGTTTPFYEPASRSYLGGLSFGVLITRRSHEYVPRPIDREY